MNYIIKLLLVIVVIYCILYIVKKILHQLQCNSIYNQDEPYTYQYVIPNFFSKKECNDIINESEHYASNYGWTTNRHNDYPTTDNQINKKWKCFEKINKRVKEELFPIYKSIYNIDSSKLDIEETFVAKYDATKINSQKSLEEHEDGSEFSFIIALNDDYIGGGTRFINKNKTYKLKQGDILLFCGQTTHEGLPVLAGIRYILTGFINYGSCLQQL